MESETRDEEDETRWRQRYGKRRTYVNLVSLECGPINLQLDLRVKHEASNALVGGGMALGDLIVERVHLLDLLRRIRHRLLVLLAPLGDRGVITQPIT
jgi:hypothetical protein